MPKFKIDYKTVTAFSVTIEAESRDEALDKFDDCDYENESISFESDPEVSNIRVVE